MDKDIKTISPNNIRFGEAQRSIKYAINDTKHMSNSIRFAEDTLEDDADKSIKNSDNNTNYEKQQYFKQLYKPICVRYS